MRLQNPVVNGLFAKPGGPRPKDSAICVYYVRSQQRTHKLQFLNANAAFNIRTRILYEFKTYLIQSFGLGAPPVFRAPRQPPATN